MSGIVNTFLFRNRIMSVIRIYDLPDLRRVNVSRWRSLPLYSFPRKKGDFNPFERKKGKIPMLFVLKKQRINK